VKDGAALKRLHLGPHRAIAGIDVGESFLDIAIVASKPRRLILRRVRLDDIADGYLTGVNHESANVITTIAARLRIEAPELEDAAAIVDSPAWPVDLDLSGQGVKVRSPRSDAGREIDQRLRRLVTELCDSGRYPALKPLALFPTPSFEYFARQITHVRCKPHLRAIGLGLFTVEQCGRPKRLIGGTFTRFMIAGCAAHRALRTICAEVYEGYPDLQFRLCCERSEFPPKKGRRATATRPGVTAAEALQARLRIIEGLAFKITGYREVKTLDQADASILALSVAAAATRGVIGVIEVAAEGRFIVAMPSRGVPGDKGAFAR